MADKNLPIAAGLLKKLKDMGDGTHAEVAAIGGTVSTLEGLSIPAHDYVGITNNAAGDPTTIVYKTGGADGTTVATVTIAYDALGNVSSITKA